MPPVQHVGWLPSILGRSILADDIDKLNYVKPDKTHALVARADRTYHPGEGSTDPSNINMRGLYALFAILGAAFVLATIWFFFWAKDGGFIWKKGDWDEYKSTVLRRKGPDGRTLSNATRSTKLGGGSIVGKGYTDDGYTVADTAPTYSDTATTITEKEPKRKRNLREKFLRRHRNEKYEGEADEDVRAYRKEKPAQIGGINREADGTYYGSDYDTSNPGTNYNQSEMSEVRDYAYEPEAPPARTRTHRQTRDFSFVPGTEDTVSQTTTERMLREPSARRHNRRRERRRAPPSHPPTSSSRQSSPRKRESKGHYTEPLDFSSAGSRSEYQYSNVGTEEEDLGTISYHHPIPGLSKGYRRDGARSKRRDSLSDSDGEETRSEPKEPETHQTPSTSASTTSPTPKPSNSKININTNTNTPTPGPELPPLSNRGLGASRNALICRYLLQGWTTKAIAAEVGVCTQTVVRLRDNLMKHGSVKAPRFKKLGRPRRLTRADEDALFEWLKADAEAEQEGGRKREQLEMAKWLLDERGVEISRATVCRLLKRRGWNGGFNGSGNGNGGVKTGKRGDGGKKKEEKGSVDES
ncbi:hypothetical protein BJY04DRAFT_221592 [Aspergillus karnatakaensis]|uniref:uncharacterized protein n=1 Tax=Aspergillus karnatakaensis TaxID=1810916 RepID=UPI003CCD1406